MIHNEQEAAQSIYRAEKELASCRPHYHIGARKERLGLRAINKSLSQPGVAP